MPPRQRGSNSWPVLINACLYDETELRTSSSSMMVAEPLYKL